MLVIAVIVDGGSGGIKPMAPMAASLTVAVVDADSDGGIFTAAFHDDAHHPHPH
jgi:hypothetical protein